MLTDNRQSIVDIDARDGMADLPLVSSTGVDLCGSDDTTRPDLYLSYFQNLWRYCGITNGRQQLCPNHILNTVRSSLKFSRLQGYRGNCLGVPANNQMDIAGLNGDVFNGKTIRIRAGTGIGQTRTITDTSEPTIADRGLATTASASLLTDSTKKRKVNQFIGRQCRLIQNTGVTQVRKILYNDSTTLYFYDANYQQLESWNNNPFSAIAPYAVPVTTAGSQSHYVIEKSTITVDTNWTVNPDYTSSYVIEGAGLFNLGGLATTPFSSFMFYDTNSDAYTYKTAPLSLLVASTIGTDFALEKIRDYKDTSGYRYVRNVAVVSATSKTVTISTLSRTNNQWKNYNIKVVAGTGIGQERRIIAHTATLLTVDRLFDITLDNTSVFDIQADHESIWMVGSQLSIMGKYDYNKDMWSPSNYFDYGTARNGAIAYGGQEAFGITSGTYLATGITSLTAIPVNKGTGYSIGDVLTIDAKGGKARVETISSGGLVETVSLINAGTAGYTTGTKTVSGGTGSSCTLNVASVGKVCKIVPASNVNLAVGDSFTISGISASGYNGASSVLAIETPTSFDILCPSASGNMTFTASQSATVLVDSTKNRTSGEHVGRLVCHQIAGYNGACLWRKITANDATSLTFATITTAPVNGLGRYFIADIKPFGKAKQYLALNQSEEGFATTTGSGTLLTDTTKARDPGCRVGYRVRITSGTGTGTEVTITANDTNTLTVSARGFTPDTTTEYQIMDTYGIATGSFLATTLGDSTKNRKVNQRAGMKLRLTGGTGQNIETVITSNTATVLTFPSITPTVPDATTTYAILDSNTSAIAGRGLGTELVRDFKNNSGKYIYSFRGGNTNIIDRYNITTEKWDLVYFVGNGQTELFTTGTNYCFDGNARIYINPNGTQRILYYDILLNLIKPFTYFPDTQGTAIIGNRMEIIQEPNGLKYLYLNRQSTVNFYRILLPTY